VTEPTTTVSTGYTAVTSDLYYNNGHLGNLKIPSLGVNVKVVQGTDSKALAKGAGHFEDTSIWEGNVCLAGHNRGVNCYFGDIHTLDIGDTITYTTKLGTRTYKVVSVQKVKETDTSMLAPTTDNRLTLYTCVKNQSAYRWCVQAVEAE
jgi:sortase A